MTAVDVRPATTEPAPLPPTRQRNTGRLVAGCVLVIGIGFACWSIAGLDLDVANINHSIEMATRVLRTMDPISLPAPRDLAYLIGLTLGIVVLGTVLAALLSVPVAVVAAANTTPAGWLRMPARAIGVLCRAVPDVVLALAFALAFPLGSAIPGILALGIHSVGMISKLFADAIEQIDRGPQLALRATGAGPVQQFWAGVLPQVLPSWTATVLHRFDINLRASAILGYAGVGGLGYAMRLAFEDFPAGYGRGLGIAGVIFALCVVVEIVSSVLRMRLLGGHAGRGRGRVAPDHATPKVSVTQMMHRPWTAGRVAATGWQVGAVGLVVASWFLADINLRDISWPAVGTVLGSFWPPSLGAHTLPEFGEAMLVTVQIAAAATLLALLGSLVIGAFAARNVAPSSGVRNVARVLLVVFRGVPELVLAIFLIMVTGLGAQAGVIALAFGGIGLLGKLVADGLEEVPRGPQQALAAVGASRTQQFAASTWPMGLPSVIGNTLYLLDTNVRAATLLGIVGAGGIGFHLTNASSVMSLHGQVTTLVAMVVGTVLLIEALAAWMRRVFS